ncbi:E3 ubiquitin-protein ligase RGLG2-like [Vigna unguiculata]|uniref:E3 ubiquitin-protein ligase mind-bomb n=1 Tax=Vigna unguiculata TaxID=3917 RepID=A0A4D6LXI9_VIGUN|nr:E3 ubiquitin-protein ligase RGLG2-like [Vigna unguiculata]XP_027924667.1 E3 ubiquitin-protein ligase RGLG2-like [Vigna unguiculata]XP_027924668.1 E3 ubiquitin-protein ligase RGLG2-like [Vigna unguiculata]QCD93425.1 E3 ubiquitin-protein ligase mind-bomb [Vigna unguiculata]
MGGNNSKEDNNWRQNSSVRSSPSASSWGAYPDPHSGYGQGGYAYEPQQPSYPTQQSYYAPPPPQQNYGYEPQPQPQPHDSGRVANHRNEKRLDRKYSRIADNYNSIDEVTEALARAGLESSNLILGIDFTKSNEWTGKHSFNRKSLHHIGNGPNPYEQAISIIGKTLAAFDEDNLIPCFGFGDASTHDQDVFSFYPDERFCNGFEEVLGRYREIVPNIRLAGPTSFAPIVEMAMTIVEQSGGQYHVLVIIADGQVTRSIDTEHGRLSPQEQKTVDAIVEASKFPLSIILVGVGDGPWDMMKEFDDNIPSRAFDNFQFVNFTDIMSKNIPPSRKEAAFALAALMEIPSQYKAAIELNLLGRRNANAPQRVALPTPTYGSASMGTSKPYGSAASFGASKPYGSASFDTSKPYGSASFDTSKPSHATGFEKSAPSYYDNIDAVGTAPPAPSSTYDNQLCPICLTNPKDMAFGCGHQTCCECGPDLQTCPICRSPINTRIKLY